MPFIGNQLSTSFQNVETQTITGDGSTSYTLNNAVADGKDLLVYINNVKQEEGSGKSYTATGTTITFTEAVASTDSCYVVFIGQAVGTVTPKDGSIVSSMLADANLEMPNTLDLNGKELILDADADTSITADTDDQIDIKIAGNDQVVIATGSTAFKAPDGGNRYALNGMGNSDSAELSLYNSSDAQKVRIGAGVDTFFDGGNVGIGVTAPSDSTNNGDNLVIGGESNVGMSFLSSATSGNGAIYFADGTSGDAAYRGILSYSHSDDAMDFGTASTAARMRINSSGAVMIGTTSSPNNAPLLVHCGTDDNLRFNQETHATISAVNDAANAFVTLKLEGDDILLNSQSGNNVGIGTTSPRMKLTVAGSNSTSIGLGIDNSDGSGTLDLVALGSGYSAHGASAGEVWFYSPDNINIGGATGNSNNIKFLNGGSERARIDGYGTLLVNKTARTLNCIQQIAYNGGSQQGLILENTNNSQAGAAIRFIDTDGDFSGGGIYFTDSNSISYQTTSDYRLKENIVTDWDATTDLKKLKPSKFNFKKTPSKTVQGFIAHEVSDIVPEAIIGEKDGTEKYIDDNDGKEKTREAYQTIDQSKLVPLMVKTIQELEARIAKLEAK
jgi:hypothetical protein